MLLGVCRKGLSWHGVELMQKLRTLHLATVALSCTVILCVDKWTGQTELFYVDITN